MLFARGLLIVGFFILLSKIFDAGGSIVAVTDKPEIFQNDAYNQPQAGKKNSD